MDDTENTSHDGGEAGFTESGVDVGNISSEEPELRGYENREPTNQKRRGIIGRLRTFSSGNNLDQTSSDDAVNKSRKVLSNEDLSKKQKHNKKRSSTTDSWRDEDFYNDVFQAINNYRKIHNAKPLKISQRMNNRAKRYATKLSKGLPANNRLGKRYGVTMFQKKITDTSEKISGLEVVTEWYQEISDFIFAENTEDLVQKGSNFSQLVWKNSSYLGIGIAITVDKLTVYVIGLFRPQGNVQGHYSKQVSPARQIEHDDNSSSSEDENEKNEGGKKIDDGNKKAKKSGKLSHFFGKLFKPSKNSEQKCVKQDEHIESSDVTASGKDIDLSSNSSGDTKSTLRLHDSKNEEANQKRTSEAENLDDAKLSDNTDNRVSQNLLKYISIDDSNRYADIVYPLDRETKVVNDGSMEIPKITDIESPSNFLEKTDSYFGIEHSISVQADSTSSNEKNLASSTQPEECLSRQSSSSSSSSSSSESSISLDISSSKNMVKEEFEEEVKKLEFIVTPTKSDTDELRKQITMANKEFLMGEIAENQEGSISLEKVTPLNIYSYEIRSDNNESKEGVFSSSSSSSDSDNSVDDNIQIPSKETMEESEIGTKTVESITSHSNESEKIIPDFHQIYQDMFTISKIPEKPLETKSTKQVSAYFPEEDVTNSSNSSNQDNDSKQYSRSFKVTKVSDGKHYNDYLSRSSSSGSSSSSSSSSSSNQSLGKAVFQVIDSVNELHKAEEIKPEVKPEEDITVDNIVPVTFKSQNTDSSGESYDETIRSLVSKYYPPQNDRESIKSSSSSDSEDNNIYIPLEDLEISKRSSTTSSDDDHTFIPLSKNIDILSSRSNSLNSLTSSEDDDKHEKIDIKTHLVEKAKNSIAEKNTFDIEKFPVNMLKEINNYRLLHGVKPLQMDYYLCCLAKKRARQMLLPQDKQKTLYNYGELSYTSSDMNVTESLIAASWYQTGETYEFGTIPEESHLPFTQIIWKDTFEFGAGAIYVESEKKYILVTLYNPEGNVFGEYKTQIYPSTQS